ncbi:DUF4158 domain-containing protein [Nonomuraea maritima]|uniref:DUF4158 domain-containing protein n=1 Tax=Nonomuraea maritima TaxID=683260 RepID=UPI003717D749
MATQFLSDEQMDRLRSYPDIGREELIRFFTLTRKDLGFIKNQDQWRRARARGAVGACRPAVHVTVAGFRAR